MSVIEVLTLFLAFFAGGSFTISLIALIIELIRFHDNDKK